MPISCAELCNRRSAALGTAALFLCSIAAACGAEHHCAADDALCASAAVPPDHGSSTGDDPEDDSDESDARADESETDADAGADAPADAGSADAGSSQPALVGTFKRLVVRSSGGGPIPLGECSSSYLDMFTLDAIGRKLSWDYCDWTSMSTRIAKGEGALDELQYQAVLNVLSRVRQSARTDCGFDKPNVTLEAEAEDGHVSTYRDDFYACREADTQRPFATNLSNIYGVLRAFADAKPLPTSGDTLEMWFSKLGHETPMGASCGWQQPAHYTLDSPTRRLSWELCRPDSANMFSTLNGSRVLSEEEQARVWTAFGQLKLGVSKPCAELQLPERSPVYGPAPSTIQVTSGSAVPTFYAYGEEASCPSTDFSYAGLIVTDVRALEQVVSALVR